jgi:hypothetical protein
MSFISYAQNYEDVMLWRALKHIDRGFYIDVGANDTDHDTMTKAFYERGWRGPGIKNVAIRWLGKYPRLASKLRGFAAVRGLIDAPFDETSNSTANAPSETEQQELIELSPRAREIYFELKAAIGRNQGSK